MRGPREMADGPARKERVSAQNSLRHSMLNWLSLTSLSLMLGRRIIAVAHKYAKMIHLLLNRLWRYVLHDNAGVGFYGLMCSEFTNSGQSTEEHGKRVSEFTNSDIIDN